MRIVGVRFKKACKIYDFNASDLDIKKGDGVVVETDRGMDIGWVIYGPVEREIKDGSRLKAVIRKADARDFDRQSQNMEWEKRAFRICQKKIEKLNLQMKLVRVEYLFDGSKAIFYFVAESRVDFRALVKELAAELHTRIEMRQIGVRDEAKMVGGLGPCGHALCCSSFLIDFEPVSVKMAKEQNLALNPAKISGLCGRLMCCLTFEQVNYSNN